MNLLVAPIGRAVSQFDDPVFLGVLARSLLLSLICFALLHVGALWVVHRMLELQGILAWIADIFGSIAASLLAMWLFLPLAAAIGTLYFDRIADAVERRWYPWLPPPNGASLTAQAWDGVVLAGKILLLNLAGLILVVTLPGIGFILGWLIAAYAIGRGLFVAVAMRRMDMVASRALYRRVRPAVLGVGGIIALMAYLPLVNLLIPVIGVAAMVHLLDSAMGRIQAEPSWPALR